MSPSAWPSRAWKSGGQRPASSMNRWLPMWYSTEPTRPRGPQAGHRAVGVGDRDLEPQRPGVPRDGPTEHVPSLVAQRGGDPQEVGIEPAVGRHHLDHVGLAQGQGPRLVERQDPEPAHLLEELPPFEQDPPPRRRRQGRRQGHRRGDHQGARAGDHQDDQPSREPGRPVGRGSRSRAEPAAGRASPAARRAPPSACTRPRTARPSARPAPGPPGPRGPGRRPSRSRSRRASPTPRPPRPLRR